MDSVKAMRAFNGNLGTSLHAPVLHFHWQLNVLQHNNDNQSLHVLCFSGCLLRPNSECKTAKYHVT